MANSPLLGGERAAQRPAGTGTDVLGPSDTTDSGSDLTGAVGAVETDEFGFDGGTNDDIRRAPGAGADVGDASLDSDSDSGGTGERAEAGRDTLREDAPDLMPDRVFSTDPDDVMADDEVAAMAADSDDDENDPDRDRTADDRETARPPQGSALPRHQRNTDRPVGAESGAESRRADEPANPRRPERKAGGNDPVSDRDKSVDA